MYNNHHYKQLVKNNSEKESKDKVCNAKNIDNIYKVLLANETQFNQYLNKISLNEQSSNSKLRIRNIKVEDEGKVDVENQIQTKNFYLISNLMKNYKNFSYLSSCTIL